MNYTSFTTTCLNCIEQAPFVAAKLGSPRVTTTNHLLLSMLADTTSVTRDLCRALGHSPQDVIDMVMRLQSQPSEREVESDSLFPVKGA